MLQDIRFALRTFRKNPAFTAVAIATLALGIGANTAMFAVVDAIVLHPVPLPRPDELVSVTNQRSSEFGPGWLSWPDYVDVRQQAGSFQGLTAYKGDQYTLTGAGEPQVLTATVATANLFSVLGVAPALGRGFASGEDEPGRNHVVVLADSLWRTSFAQDPNIIGRSIALNGEPYTVIGVAPPRFHFGPREDGLFALLPHGAPDEALQGKRGIGWLRVIGRLEPGVSLEAAQSELNTLQSRLAATYPEDDGGHTLTAKHLLEGPAGPERSLLFVLLGAVGFVLLMACANLSNLLLARATTRQLEISVRVAVGAGRSRLIRQLLTESVLLSVIGGGIGLLVASWAIDALGALIPRELHGMAEISIDPRVLLLTLTVSVATGLIFGLAPALYAARVDSSASLAGTTRTLAGGQRYARSALLVSEVALAMILLVGAGLTLRSFSRLSRVDPGFDPHGVLTASLALPTERYPNAQTIFEFFRETEERLRAIPGARASTLSELLPLSGCNIFLDFRIDGRPEVDGKAPVASFRLVGFDYFGVMGIRAVRGRTFIADDELPDARPTAIINESTARTYWPDEDPIGKHFTMTLETGDQSFEVIGIVADVRFASLALETEPEVYVLLPQLPLPMPPGPYFLSAAIRGPDVRGLEGPLRAAVSAVDSYLPVTKVVPMDDYLSESLSRQRWSTLLFGLFGALALLLAVVGVYGVMSYSVTQRTRELGIRLALGASTSQVLRMVLFNSLKLTLAGVALGGGVALVFARSLASKLETEPSAPTLAMLKGATQNVPGLYGVSATDPITFLGLATLLVVVALLASYPPARRATQVDPMIAMQAE